MGKDADCCDACRMFGDETKAPPPPPPPAPAADVDRIKLVVTGRHGEEREILPAGRFMTVGRGKQCDIQISDVALSRVQCALFFDERGVFIKDSGSTCGTIVYGRTIYGPVKLDVGTTVYFGNSMLRVVAR